MSTLTVPIAADEPSLLGAPRCENVNKLEADIAVIGIPYTHPYGIDGSRQVSSPAPQAIRGQSQRLVKFLTHYDYDFGGPILAGRDVRIVDCGNVKMEPGQYDENASRATRVVRTILDRGAIPVVLGGDHAVPIPVFRAYEGQEKMHVIQIDAHIDWRDEREGTSEGLSSPMRRASELAWVSGMSHLGIRSAGSARASEFEAAREYGAQIIGARELHRIGVEEVLRRIPDADRYYITVDVDGMDPSIAPGVRTIAFGGVDYYEATELLQGLAQKGKIVGYDIVEVVPSLDVGNLTSFLAARLTLNLIGAMAHAGQFGRA